MNKKVKLMSKKKKLVFIAVVWFLLANIFFSIFGRALAPSGGIDSIGAMLIYVFLWRTFIIIPPIIMLIVAGSMFLYERLKKSI